MAKKKSRNQGDNVALEMTPMIDVVFQLLIFFIVTLKQEDILSQLDALRPAPDPKATVEKQVEPTSISIGRYGLIFREKRVTVAQLDKEIARIAKYDKDKMVIIKCSTDSYHKELITALDICVKHGLTKLSVFSL